MESVILLVDDVQMYIEIEKDFLKYTYTEIVTAKDGLEALDVIKARRPDLVIMDLHMPRMDGAACCKVIKSRPDLLGMPVVMATFKGNKEDEDACLSAGCDHLLTKPLDRDRFLGVIRHFIPNTDRREKRVATSIEGTIRSDGTALGCTLHNVSAGGAYIGANFFGIPGRVIQISFKIPGGTVIECSGKIAWMNRVADKQPVGFGIKFSMISRDAQEALDRFVQTSE